MNVRSLLTVACIAIGANSAFAQQDYTKDRSPVNATNAGAAAQGMFAAAGEAVNEMVRREYPNSAITYEPGSAAGSLARMMRGQVSLSSAHSSLEIAAALTGTEPFPQKLPAENLKLIAVLTPGMHSYLVARPAFVQRYNVKTSSDMFAKPLPLRLNMNQKGTISVYHQARALLEYYKTSEEQLSKAGGEAIYLPTRAAAEALKDGKIDALFWVTNTPDPTARELIEQQGMILIPIEAGAIDFIAKKFSLQKEFIKAGTYKGQERDLPTTNVKVFMSAGPSADDRTVYAITNAMLKHFDYYRSVHPLFKTFERHMLSDVGALKLHPAAERAYREAGVLK
jgi:uncharacterized protein